MWREAGASLAGLERGRLPSAWTKLLAMLIAETRALFEGGRPVCDAVSGRLRYELRATWHGGMRILERLEAGGCDPFRRRPSLGRTDAMVIAWRSLVWAGGRTPVVPPR
jgi:phytoene/squalene synthetase